MLVKIPQLTFKPRHIAKKNRSLKLRFVNPGKVSVFQ